MPIYTSTPTTTYHRSRVSTQHDVAGTSTLKPLSITESYEGPFEKILGNQHQRICSIYNKSRERGDLDKINKAAFDAYKDLKKNNIDKIDETNSLLQDAENLLKKLKITLISDFDSIASLKQAIQENILVPKTSNGQIWIDSNSELTKRMNEAHKYLLGRILAINPVLNSTNPRVESKELFAKINQAAIEKFFTV